MSYDLKLNNGDLQISNTGDLQLVKDSEKLRQDVLKILITPVGGNKAHTWYGSNVGNALIGGFFDKEFTMNSATQQVRNALETLQIMQKSQSKTQTVTSAEMIMAIKDVYINTNPTDPRVVQLRASVLTSALTAVDVKFYVRL